MSKRKLLWVRIILTALGVLAVGFIFCNSMMDADESTVQSDATMGWLSGLLKSLGFKDIEMTSHFIRKTAHFVEFFTMGALLSGAVYSYVLSVKRMLLIALPLGLAVAVCDELIQLGSAGRSCEIGDMALDFSAVLTAALILSLILICVKKRKAKKVEGNE